MAVPIGVKCPACEAAFFVKEELAGKRIRCVKCRAVINVSALQVAPSAAKQVDIAAPAEGRSAKIGPASSPTLAASSAVPVASPAPVVRRARRVTAEELSAAAPSLSPSPAAPPTAPLTAASRNTAESSTPVRARIITGPRDVQADAVRHTAATLSVPPEDFETLRQKVFASFLQQKIATVPIAASYRIGIALVSLFMIMLPLIYVALIGITGWSVWYHASQHTGIITAAASSTTGRNSGRAVVFGFLIYVTPIIAGVALVLFMFKPLFSKPVNDSGRRTLKPADEPLLFEFVDRICRAVNSPRPHRIDIDCNINASASFGRGLLSFMGNDLVLTLGMPLVAGLTMRQFGGVLAHEFGHFSQGAGMRLTFVIRSISHWFTRVVYERDAWDEKLADWSRNLDIRIGWIFYITRLGIWVTRQVLWVLMVAGHFVGGYLLRQMEFDADRHETRLAGSRTFATTARQISVLNVAYRGAMADLGNFYREGRLGDNLPKLILLNVDQLPEKIHAKIDEMILASKTGLFDTHPSDRERTASASKENTDGIFQLRLPAAHLFKRFDFLSRAVTWDYYKEIFGEELKKSDLHPVEKLMEIQKTQRDAWKALQRFFQGHVAWYRAFPNPKAAFHLPKDVVATTALMKKSRGKMLQEAEQYGKVWTKFDEGDSQLIEIGLADILLKAGLKIRRKDFSISLTSRAEVQSAREAVEIRQEQLEPKLMPFEDAAADRLYASLQLARTPAVLAALAELSVTNSELDQLLKIFTQVNERLGQLLVIRDSQIAMGKLLTVLSDNNENPPLIAQIRNHMSELSEQIQHLRESFESTSYPFDHARADITVADYLLQELPDPENPVALYEAADSIGNALPPMQARVTGRLCQIAEMVETHFGLPLLEDPPEDEEVDLGDDEDE
jgi:predicted Zn finger-like uncharacterized protein